METLQAIPCNIITGFLGVGKTTTMLNLLKQKPVNEKWAVLVNEFGEIGLDGALIESALPDNNSIFIKEVPGGCMCCASGLPMQIALNMLLMKAKPDRLLIEPTGLGHPKEVIKTLTGEHYQKVLSLENTLTVLDARHFTSQKHLKNPTFQQQLEVADLLVVNKADLASDKDIAAFKGWITQQEHVSGIPQIYIEKGALSLSYLDNARKKPAPLITQTLQFSVHKPHLHKIENKHDSHEPFPECGFIVKSHKEGDFTSVGWNIKPDKIFDISQVRHWLSILAPNRAKAILRTASGLITLNLNEDQIADLNKDVLDSFLNISPPNDVYKNNIEVIFEGKTISEEMIRRWSEWLIN